MKLMNRCVGSKRGGGKALHTNGIKGIKQKSKHENGQQQQQEKPEAYLFYCIYSPSPYVADLLMMRHRVKTKMRGKCGKKEEVSG
jgi:hypothetical protein